MTNIPLPIGHEAKGLVLPDFDGDGRLRGKFEAGTAHRIDQEHVGFQHLKITTYTPESQPDLQIDMNTSVLDLKTRILSSQERTTIQRSDFNIAGDSVQFDTNSKTGRLIGNVKMVITDKSHLTAKPKHERMKKLAVLVLFIACAIGARSAGQIAAAPAGSPCCQKSRETGKDESEKQGQKER